MSMTRLATPPTSNRWFSSKRYVHGGGGLSHKIRALLRETAQPVTVVTSLMPDLKPTSPSIQSRPSLSTFHGATLSSFTSISMTPHHLVAFSLRVPSRMATTLRDLSAAASFSSTHMVINLLAAPQAHAAILFSRPDLHSHPFEDPDIQWSLSPDGLPILHGCLGALSCRVVGAPWRLNDLAALGDKLVSKVERTRDSANVDDVESELFIAQVIRVEDVPKAKGVVDDSLRTLPLVYHRRGYATTSLNFLLNQEASTKE
ncbi:flavin reductase like domain-containing protein [Multifurca ochricompacta]|uniref:Flavin reductase like domain-containing protein n=1 Tax=Multifurca ochricompacta TaxID=376703 RepID=A0AAD4QPV3_9AGAM|nr:flavin reductase like domain-containing protein [Multifurca ochricompacta]